MTLRSLGHPAVHPAQASSLWPAPHDDSGDVCSLDLLAGSAAGRTVTAYISVSDVAGRVLYRRLATEAEVMRALEAAHAAEIEAQAVMDRIARERTDHRMTARVDAG